MAIVVEVVGEVPVVSLTWLLGNNSNHHSWQRSTLQRDKQCHLNLLRVAVSKLLPTKQRGQRLHTSARFVGAVASQSFAFVNFVDKP